MLGRVLPTCLSSTAPQMLYPLADHSFHRTSAQRVAPRLARFLRSLEYFIPEREAQVDRKLKRTKVAIIDNGILSITPRAQDNKLTDAGKRNNEGNAEGPLSTPSSPAMARNAGFPDGKKNTASAGFGEGPHPDPSGRNRSLWSRIVEGRSFVDDGSKVSPWLFASDPHGTQMANLICAMDPFCELYVARVAEGTYGITPTRVARVCITISLLD
jgi:hypothetical protein